MKGSRMAIVRRAAWALAALAACAFAVTYVSAHSRAAASAALYRQTGMTPLGGTPAPDFTLTDQSGAPLTMSRLRGKVVLLTFIDSQCTTQCPLTAATLRYTLDRLGAAKKSVEIVAVNVNAAYRTVGDVRIWTRMHGMNGLWRFVTGSPAALSAIWQRYHIYVTVVDGDVEHTSAVYVIGRGGRERWVETTSESPAPAAMAESGAALAQAADALLAHPVALRSAPTPSVSRPRPDKGYALPRLGGGTLSVGRGHLQLLAFFATWCQACAEDMKVIEAYDARQRTDAALPPVVAVDMRVAEPGTSYVASFAKAHRLEVPIALDTDGTVTDAFGVTALPTLVLVRPNGSVAWQHTGVATMAEISSAVRAAS